MQAFGSQIGSEIKLQWVDLNLVSSYLNIDDLGIATCTGTTKQGSSDNTCKLVMNLQKQNEKKGWDTIATWSKDGTTRCIKETRKAVTKGTYRLTVIGKVYDSKGNFIESGSEISVNKTY